MIFQFYSTLQVINLLVSQLSSNLLMAMHNKLCRYRDQADVFKKKVMQ